MTVKGYIEVVDHLQIKGWAFDSDSPSYHVLVEVFLQQQLIASATASLFRKDLLQNGFGSGDHLFDISLDRILSPLEMAEISVIAVSMDGYRQPLTLVGAPEVSTALLRAPIQFIGNVVDLDQQPVFILGAARSGTSAMAEGLLAINHFKGHPEGHLLELMTPFIVASRRFYLEKSDALNPYKNTSLSLVPEKYILSALDHLFITMVRDLHGSGAWIDKTPSLNMIFLAPVFLRIWPNSRFIFMKRRAVENVASRLVKFPTVSFVDHCKEWGLINSTWLKIRSDLSGSAIEIDQYFLEKNPVLVAEALEKFLSLTDEQALRLGQTLASDHPERTTIAKEQAPNINQMGWSEDIIQIFNGMCSNLMYEYGYSHGAEYFSRGVEQDGLVLI